MEAGGKRGASELRPDLRPLGATRRHADPGAEPQIESVVAQHDQTHAAALRRLGRAAAVLYLIGALSATAASMLLEPRPGPEVVPIIAVIVCLGLVWLAFPWEHAHRAWFHAVIVIGTLAVAATAATVAPAFGSYLIPVALLAGYVCRNRAELAAHLVIMVLALLASLLYEPDSAERTARWALMILPCAVLAAGIVSYLQEQLEQRERLYQGFALEALSLVRRIERSYAREPRPAPVMPLPPQAEFQRLREQAAALPLPPRVRAPIIRHPAALAAGLVAFLLAMTLFLALIGVSVPEPLRAPFEAFGIDLPNQPAGDQPRDTDADPSSADGAVALELGEAPEALPPLVAGLGAISRSGPGPSQLPGSADEEGGRGPAGGRPPEGDNMDEAGGPPLDQITPAPSTPAPSPPAAETPSAPTGSPASLSGVGSPAAGEAPGPSSPPTSHANGRPPTSHGNGRPPTSPGNSAASPGGGSPAGAGPAASQSSAPVAASSPVPSGAGNSAGAPGHPAGGSSGNSGSASGNGPKSDASL